MKNIFMAKIFEYEPGDGFSVIFPELDGCFSCADTYEEAILMASESLTGYLLSILARGKFVERPNNLDNSELVSIAPSEEVQLALRLRWQREDLQLSPEQMAAKLGLEIADYRQLEKAEFSFSKMLAKFLFKEAV